MEEGVRMPGDEAGPASIGENSVDSGTGLAGIGEDTVDSGVDFAVVGAGLLAQIKECFPGKQADVRAYSPLALAYIGDAIYDLIIRTVVVERANRPANELHRITVRYVSAGAQSKIVEALMDSFTEEELAVYRRGRNSKPHTTAKNASAKDYLQATGFEAVLGYLYLADNMPRVLELVREGIAHVDVNDNIFFRG